MIETSIPISTRAEFLRGTHLSSDIYKLALYTGKADLGKETVGYTLQGEVNGGGYETGGKELTGYSISQENGTVILSFTTPRWERVTISARGCMIYNSTRENKVIAIYDFGKVYSSTNAEFAAVIPEATKEKGLIRIS